MKKLTGMFARKLAAEVEKMAAGATAQQQLIDAQAEAIVRLERRVGALEHRLINYYRERWDCVDKLADYLVGAQLPGDYYEFGVFQGETFSYAMNLMAGLFPEMRFVALDSFEGLPVPEGLDAKDGFTSSFVEGEFACAQQQFMANLTAKGCDLSRVCAVPGWFNKSLVVGNPDIADLGKVTAAWIDCDLYESTGPVLDFLTDRLSVGSVLLFDDWRCYRNHPDYGEQLACREWLARNPQIKLREFVDFGFHGQSFTVETC
jgi:O-methyltransferase